jgi:hypothetical protein
MPSWQARTFNLGVCTLVRRRDWGDVGAVARRARAVFGAPWPYQWIARQGLEFRQVSTGRVNGEWLMPSTRPAARFSTFTAAGSCRLGRDASAYHRIARSTDVDRGVQRELPPRPGGAVPAALDDVVTTYEWLVRETGPVHRSRLRATRRWWSRVVPRGPRT